MIKPAHRADVDRSRFIEDVGMLFEEIGQPRMAGKILGSLLICHPPYLTATELIDHTGGSKASISSMTRLLLQVDFLEKVGIPGKKRVYYRIKDGSFGELLKGRLSIIKDMSALVERGLALVRNSDASQYNRLKEIRELYEYFGRELPLLLDNWESRRTAKRLSRI